MRVLVAPGDFAGALSAVEAAATIAAGWRRHAPADDVTQVPVAGPGAGAVEVLHAALGGDLHAVTVEGPLGVAVPAALLVADEVAYVEAAAACGAAVLPGRGERALGIVERASTYGVGQLVAAALDAGAGSVVVALGDVVGFDGGAGLLAALGATAAPDDALRRGALGLASLASLDVAPACGRVNGHALVAAYDVATPMLGLRGTVSVHGRTRGLSAERLVAVDGALTRLAHLGDRRLADEKGAGAGGGLGYALRLLGASLRPGFDVVAEALGLAARVAASDLVVMGIERLDPLALGSPVVAGVTRQANGCGVPCIVLAGEVEVGSRELRAGGVEAAYAVRARGDDAAGGHPADALAALAARVARTWSRT